jgi:cold shock CspA family protein
LDKVLAPDRGGKDIFAHAKETQNQSAMAEGVCVSYMTSHGRDGRLCAVDVRVIEK